MIAGSYDSYIREFAEDARDWGHPFFLRFNWEMNGNWFPWMEGVNGNQPGESVAAWRHVHDIFTAVGATNVTWVWCPNVDPGNKLRRPRLPLPRRRIRRLDRPRRLQLGPRPRAAGPASTSLYSSTYHAITDTIAPSKPMMIGEMGSSENGGSKASWISEALAEIPTEFPKIRGDALVRHLRRRHGLADRDLEQRQQRLRQRHPERRLPHQLLRRPGSRLRSQPTQPEPTGRLS